MRTRSLLVAALGATTLPFVAVSATASSVLAAPPAVPANASAYVSQPTPDRRADTRVSGAMGVGATMTVSVAGAAPLPPAGTTTAVVLNVTAIGPAAPGFFTVFPHGAPRPNASNLNVDERASMLGDALAIPNMVTVPVGPDGLIDIFSSSGGNVTVDLYGSYQSTGGQPVAAGRLVPLPNPQRFYNSQLTPGIAAGSTNLITVPGGVGASAAVLNVTAIGGAAGFWTAYPTGTVQPTTSNLNSLALLHVAANQVIVGLDATGSFNMFSLSGGHLLIDLVGLISGPTAEPSTAGLFVPLATPTRFLDTRDPALSPLGGKMMLPRWDVEVPVATNPAINRTDVAAVSLNVAITDSLAPGFVTTAPAGANDPAAKTRETSTINVERSSQTLPNHSIVAVSARGFDVFVLSGGNVIADVAGYYLGTPVAAPFGGPQSVDGTPPFCLGYPTAPVGAIVNGSSTTAVARVQQRLIDLGFWNNGPDGGYGWSTSQAVMAFQKWAGLSPSSNVDEATAVALNNNLCRPGPTITGDGFEIDKRRQIAFIVRASRAVWILNVSTGGDYAYQAKDLKTGGDASGIAHTPEGTFGVYRVSNDPAYQGSLGTLYRPRFFSGGVAVHGYRNVPNYPASHGCVRVSFPAMDMIWDNNFMPVGGRVVVHS